MFGSLGAPELIIIGLIVVLLFGVGKISGLGREVGSSIKEFRKAVKDEDAEKEVVPVAAPPQQQYVQTQPQYTPAPQYAQPQQQYAPQPQYAPAPQQQYAPAPQPQYAPPQPQYAPPPQQQYAPAPQPQYAPAPPPPAAPQARPDTPTIF